MVVKVVYVLEVLKKGYLVFFYDFGFIIFVLDCKLIDELLNL